MTLVIDASVGSASANSFVLLSEADAYVEARLNSTTWDDSTDDTKNRALVEATRELNVLSYKGGRSSTTQSLAWPRSFAPIPAQDATWSAWQWYDSGTIPRRVKDATCELALQFVLSGTTDIASLDPNAGVIEKTVDVLTTRWQPYQKPTAGLQRFPRVWNLVSPLLSSSGFTVPTVRN